MPHLYYPRCETLNRWCSFDTHFHTGAGSMSLLLLPIKEANNSDMTSHNQCPLWLPRMQDLTSLTLFWRSFPGWGRERLSIYFDHKGGQFIQKEHRCTIVDILQLTVRYLNANTNRKPDIQSQRLEPTGSTKPGETRGLRDMVPALDCREAAGRCFGRFWIRTKPFFTPTPGPLAGYPEPLLTLPINLWVSPCLRRPVESNLWLWLIRLFHLWSHWDILLSFAKYWRWYVILIFGYPGCDYTQKKETHAPCPILEMSVNRASMIFSFALWVIWVVSGCRQS